MSLEINRKIVVAIAGASGSIYAKLLLDAFSKHKELTVGVLMSDNAKTIWDSELGNEAYKDYPFTFYNKNDFNAPFASGSAQYDSMIVIPCSMGTLGRIANGISNDLLTRAADVILKERRTLILVAREAPYSLMHLNNMKLVTEAGGIICPATPSFYSNPTTIEELAQTVVDRVIDLLKIDNKSFRWGE